MLSVILCDSIEFYTYILYIVIKCYAMKNVICAKTKSRNGNISINFENNRY